MRCRLDRYIKKRSANAGMQVKAGSNPIAQANMGGSLRGIHLLEVSHSQTYKRCVSLKRGCSDSVLEKWSLGELSRALALR